MRRATLFPLALLLAVAAPVAAEEEAPLVLTDVTEAAGLGKVAGDRFSFGDYDGDGDPDLLVNGKALLRNDTESFGEEDAKIRFTDVTAATGIRVGPGGGACWVDIDHDGDLDVVTLKGGLKVQVSPANFQNYVADTGLEVEKRMQSLGVGDVDGDGFADLLFGGGEDWNDGKPHYYDRKLFRNLGNHRFEDVTKDHDLGGGRYGRAVVLADHDRDGDLDAYLGNYRLMANELLVNEGGRLVNRAKEAGVEGKYSDDRARVPNGPMVGYRYGHTIASSWADLDADGDLDLWVSNLVHKFAGTYDGQYDVRGWICDDSAIYRNDGPPAWGFTDVRPESGIPLRPTGPQGVFRGDELWSNAAIADLDLDGHPEVFVTQVYKLPYSHSLLFRNLGGMRFEEVSKQVGVTRFDSYGAAFADVDGDGDPDLVTNGRPSPEGDREVKLYRNDTEQKGQWIAFRLHHEDGDAMPIGVQVVLEGDGWRVVGQLEGAMGSHTQQNEGLVRFGLGQRKVEAAWVHWPGGVVQRLRSPEPGRVHDVAYPDVEVPRLVLDPPEDRGDGTRLLRARRRGGSLAWKYLFDLDQDGVFETKERSGKVVREAQVAEEVRVRVWHTGKGVGKERVWRLDAAD